MGGHRNHEITPPAGSAATQMGPHAGSGSGGVQRDGFVPVLGNKTNDVNSGGRYNPNTNAWIATSTTNAPTGRTLHTAVWTGNEMIVWGGTGNFMALNTGGRYDPVAGIWAPTSVVTVPSARSGHTA